MVGIPAQVSLEALLVLLERPPPVGAMTLVGVNCLRLAGRALVSSHRLGGTKAEEVEGAGARVTSNEENRKMVLERLPEIQVQGESAESVGCWGVVRSGLGLGEMNPF